MYIIIIIIIILEIAQQLRVALDASYLTCTIFKTVFHNS